MAGEPAKAEEGEGGKLCHACIQHLRDEKEGRKCLERMIKHFKRQKKVMENTLAEIQEIFY